MHRTIQISLPSEKSDEVCRKLLEFETVISLSIVRGASMKPPGDMLIVDALNLGSADVLKLVEDVAGNDSFSITTSESASLIDPAAKELLKKDVDEAVWEEIIAGLRHQGRVTTNFILLMICGGAISAVGLVSEPVAMMMAFAAAGIVAPGFEPVVAIPLGIVFRRAGIILRGSLSLLAGYLTLIFSTALIMWILIKTENAQLQDMLNNPSIQTIINPTLKEIIVSAFGAAAGIIITASYRRSVIAGALIALVMIPAAAIIGTGIATGEMSLMLSGLRRLGIDIAFVVGIGIIVFGLKQYFVHRRKPLL